MSLAEVLRFSSTALRGHRLRTGLSLLGVAVGVAAVVVLTSLGEGARLFVTGEFALLGSNLVLVLPGKVETAGALPAAGGTTHDLTLADVEALRRIPDARHVAALVIGTATTRRGERSRSATIAGTSAEWRLLRKLEVASGQFLPAGDPGSIPRVCVIGPKLMRELFAGASPLGESIRIGDERYRVIGVLAPRGVSIGLDLDEVALVPIAQAMRMFDRRSVFRVFVEGLSGEAVPGVKVAVKRVLAERHGEDDVTVLTQDAVVATAGKVLSILTATLFGLASISLVVAGVGIMNVMLVSVSERTREVGLLKALGASSRQVRTLFLAEAALLSTAGGLGGLAAGGAAVVVFRNLYPVFPAQPPPWAVAAALLVSVTVGLVSGVLPARRAARLEPVAALARR